MKRDLPEALYFCLSHWRSFRGTVTTPCPQDPSRRDLAKERCHVAGPFKDDLALARWVCKIEAQKAEAECEEEVIDLTKAKPIW